MEYLVEKFSTSEVFSRKPHEGLTPPPTLSALRVKHSYTQVMYIIALYVYLANSYLLINSQEVMGMRFLVDSIQNSTRKGLPWLDFKDK